jgi:hypothetical protein
MPKTPLKSQKKKDTVAAGLAGLDLWQVLMAGLAACGVFPRRLQMATAVTVSDRLLRSLSLLQSRFLTQFLSRHHLWSSFSSSFSFYSTERERTERKRDQLSSSFSSSSIPSSSSLSSSSNISTSTPSTGGYNSSSVSISSNGSLPRLRLFLDIDDCLLNSHNIHPNEINLAKNYWDSLGIQADCLRYSKDHYFSVAFRPGLFSFLNEVKTFADIYLFTAGDLNYAAGIARLIDPNASIIQRYWARETVSWSPDDFYVYTKDLHQLENYFIPTRSILIDNSISNMILQPENCILSVTSFTLKVSPKQALNVQHLIRYNSTEVNPFDSLVSDLRLLSSLDDVRPYLREKYQIRKTLQNYSFDQKWNEFILSIVNKNKMKYIGDSYPSFIPERENTQSINEGLD